MEKAKIVEIFSSIQGEGLYVGQVQTFVRFYGCNIDCLFCDESGKNKFWYGISKNEIPTTENRRKLSPKAIFLREYSPRELIRSVIREGNSVVSFTGGEPLLYSGFLKEVLPYLKKKGLITYLETNGILKNKLLEIIDFLDIISMDIKLPSSTGMGPYWKDHANFLKEAVKKKVFVKSVITDKTSIADIKKAVAVIKGVNKDIFFILQPATINNKIQKIKYAGRFLAIADSELSNVRLIPQVHKILGLK